MILSGEKKEEYREKKDYWIFRLCDFDKCLDTNSYDHFKQFDAISFKNGYSKTAREMLVEFISIKIGCPNPEWCDDPSEEVFIIKRGKLLSTKNIDK